MLATGIQRKDLERGNQEPVGKNLQGSRLTQFNGQINSEDTFPVLATHCWTALQLFTLSDPNTCMHISYSAILRQSIMYMARRSLCI